MAAKKATKNGHGGSRRNSGRPGSALTKSRDDWDGKITDLISPDVAELVAALKRLALGVVAEKMTDDGKIVYQMPPDFKAASYLLDRIAGKPKQAVAIDASKLDMRTAAELTNQAAVEYVDPDEEEKADG